MRAGTHAKCTGQARDMLLFHRETGARGEAAEVMFKEYKERKLHLQWEELPDPNLHTVPKMLSPLPRTPSPRYRSPLEGCYSRKRHASPRSVPPAKKSCPQDDVDFTHDPVDIQIQDAVQELYEEPDPSLAHVYFPSPIKVDPVHTLSDSSSDEDEVEEENIKKVKSVCFKVSDNKTKHTEVAKTLESDRKCNKSEDPTKCGKDRTTEKKNSEIKTDMGKEVREKKGQKDKDRITEVKEKKSKDSKCEKPERKCNETTEADQMKCNNSKSEMRVLKNKDSGSAHLKSGKKVESSTTGGSSETVVTNSGDNISIEENLRIMSQNFNETVLHQLMKNIAVLKHPEATKIKAVDTVEEEDSLAQELTHKTFLQLQRVQEQRVTLCIGGRDFHTSRVTLRADPHSLLAQMLKETCPLRPSKEVYFFDRDPSHFRFILNFLRNGAHIDAFTLPRERRYLLELLTEARFYYLRVLEETILDRLQQTTRSRCY